MEEPQTEKQQEANMCMELYSLFCEATPFKHQIPFEFHRKMWTPAHKVKGIMAYFAVRRTSEVCIPVNEYPQHEPEMRR